jgi:F-type H+-transporting ATPase subunit delta
MRGVSRESFAAGKERLGTLLAGTASAPASVAEDLFAVTGVLAGNAGLRRALTDVARTGEAKAQLVAQLFVGRVSAPSLDLLSGLVRGRWASSADLTDAVEHLAVDAELAAADRAGRLEAVEDELFRFSRTVAADSGLRDAFSGRTLGAERKAALVSGLLRGKVAPETERLAVQAAVAPRGLRTEQVLENYVEAAAARRRQFVAHVVAAVPLTAGQRARLASALRRVYSHDVQLNVDVDPALVGGLRVTVGGEQVDGSTLGRLEAARRLLAS